MGLTRRRFLLGGLGMTGALIVGWGVSPMRQRLQATVPLPVIDGSVSLNGWMEIATNGRVTMFLHKSEMGQGVSTALPMLLAEELDVPLAMVDIVPAGMDKIYGNVAMLVDGLPFHPDDSGMLKHGAQWMTGKFARELGLQVTGGSSSVKDSWLVLRQAGSAARAMLIASAAQQWNVPVSECHTKAGMVLHTSGKQAGYGELAALAVHSNPAQIRLKNPSEFTLIGQPQARRDSADKTTGKAQFGLDVRLPGMLYAAVKMCPKLGGKLRSMNDADIIKMPGVVKVHSLADLNARVTSVAGVLVIAKTYWQARVALDAMNLEWDDGVGSTGSALSSASVLHELRSKLDTETGFTYFKQGHIKAEAKQDAITTQTLNAEYSAPFLAHATMEPMNCTAQVHNGRVSLWVGTQTPTLAVKIAAQVAQVNSDQIELHHTFLGGGFGRRLEVDMVAQAVAAALQTNGVPVQLIWSREEDIGHDFYRPAAVARFKATVDQVGQVISYENTSASGSITQQVLKRYFGLAAMGPDKTTAEGEFDMPYEFPNQKIAHVIVPTAVPIGYWRSVGHSHNAFFKESFIDELAHAAKQTPLQFRRGLLKQHPRYLAVLNAAMVLAEQGGVLPAGHAHGIALHQSFGTIVAQVAEVSVQDKEIIVHKVSCAVDCGIVVNPNIVRQQMESAVLFGLSAALFGEITFKDGKVEQSNFHDYVVIRMNQAPQVEVVIIASAEAPEGIGEPGTPPIAPAVANALFNLTGQRLRSLPLRLA
ncbi:xanthine dehydrogenase family protein molybdopterin-binding subunit [Solimicrobium silvestre]|uniref:Molybdopterin-binding domain of aldehyde dehydrogenase n=1 Tax=Solimicrobium silvestre TaxID=2099400 RepID=A0A2S9GUW7_9BURK|nr:xanthine dehydrogenase family protein molybdopterin-binding subunit [Solimicrobium silvestre]PRC91504.1 Molybdopterin-binding domain of aldehyde dehydrogenase [Solimicrobium silvestre]